MHTCPRAACLLASLAFVLLAGGCGSSSGPAKTDRGTTAARAGEEALESARQLLQAGTDRANCNLALMQVNNFLAQNPSRRAASLSPEQRTLLEKRFGLDKTELDELDSSSCTALDDQHLDLCFLLRDATQSLDLDRLSAAERAAAGFAWVVRQVMIQEREGELVPPDYVLRRGWGTALERGYVFLAVLHQLGVPGCFVASPGGAPWACGALVEDEGKDKQILLFDHRLGLPLPGAKGSPDGVSARAFRLALTVPGSPDGTTIATLDAVRKQPELLAALKKDDKTAYDVSPEQVKEARPEVAVPLSALAPRQRVLQDELLPPVVRVRLAIDAAALLQAFGSAGGVDGGADGVGVRRESASLLRRFLPEAEGGTDKKFRREQFLFTMVPIQSLPPQVLALEGEPLRFLELRFVNMFVGFLMEPNTPRDHVLRGRLKEASEALTVALDQARVVLGVRQVTPEVEKDFVMWVNEIRNAYGDLERAQQAARRGGPAEAVEAARGRIEGTWKNHHKSLTILLSGAAAEPRRAQAMYMQAQAMHEQAERAQARLDALARAMPPADPADLASARTATVSAWKEGAGWWESLVQDYPHGLYSSQARVLLARAREALGNPTSARQLLEEMPGEPGRWERLGRLYQAGRLAK